MTISSPDADVSAAPSLIFRSLTLGLAAGMRSSLGFAAPGLFSRSSQVGAIGTAARALGVTGELVADKLPITPSRLEPPGLAARVVGGAAGARALAAPGGSSPVHPVLAGIAGALLGSYGGAGWRRWAGARVPDWQCALVEDGVALALAFVSCRRD